MRKLLLIFVVVLTLVAQPSATIYTSQKTVTTTATQLSINTNSQILLVNQSAATSVFIGSASVTAANGVELKSGATLSLALATGEVLYGIVASGTARVDTLENNR